MSITMECDRLISNARLILFSTRGSIRHLFRMQLTISLVYSQLFFPSSLKIKDIKNNETWVSSQICEGVHENVHTNILGCMLPLIQYWFSV